MEKLSLRGKKITVIALCLVSGGYCSWIIYQSFHTGHTKIFSVTSIQKPAHVTETGEASIENGVVISEAEYKRITDFRKSMDSLTASTAGKRIADSILFLRPGLMDSIYRFEQLYQLQQLKTK
ncbi:MAG TPA: hypothetical protein PLL71_04240 [Agriterribacter sp.]|nr:hypothetical protein [Agriterribacter sp.]